MSFDNIKKMLRELNGKEIEAGFFPEAVHAESGVSYAEIAAINNYGTQDGHIPPRPFMDAAKELFQETILEELEKKKPQTAEELVNVVGEYYKWCIVSAITEYAWTPNSPLTIRKKGSSEPLIESGDMAVAVDFRVR